jgi:NADPH-dependent 2,4-dienoyl-CoA reductase/sulfur reductase-like enzyme/rhodanese-related sulfurtransferase
MALKLLIIGGVAGGATAAARARRVDEHAQIILFERGEYISFANCGLPYYIGGVIQERDKLLVTTKESFSKRYRIDVRSHTEVTAIDRDAREVEVTDLLSNRTYRESYDRLIIAPGAEPIRPPIPGIELEGVFHLRNIPDTDRIKAVVDLEKPSAAVVIGGGFIGLEMAENLAHRGVNTTILEMADQVMAPIDPEMAGFVHEHLTSNGIRLELKERLSAIHKIEEGLSVETASGKRFSCDMVISSVGVAPENKLAKDAGLEIGPKGHMIVDETMATSDPRIFAVGDAVQITDRVTGRPTAVALAGPANKQARIASDNALGRRSVYNGALGTSVVKIFKLTVAGTGVNEKTLSGGDTPYLVSYTHSGSHASYYPGAAVMAIKLLFSPEDGRILGAQVIGEEGVDKRIDVLATAVHAGMTVHDLEELDLAYAPPYSSAKDPVNVAGFVAANILKGDMEIVRWDARHEWESNGTVLLDVRSAKEVEKQGMIPGAVHIHIDDLRDRLNTLDPEKEHIAYCAVGMRGYLAARILAQHGFKVRNLSGGVRTYDAAVSNGAKRAQD